MFYYLVQYQHEHKDCYFVPRKKNTFGRLDLNYYFIGNETYLMITFWDGGDQNEKIHNINFGIEDDGHCFIEISSNDREERGIYLEKLVFSKDIMHSSNNFSLFVLRFSNSFKKSSSVDLLLFINVLSISFNPYSLKIFKQNYITKNRILGFN